MEHLESSGTKNMEIHANYVIEGTETESFARYQLKSSSLFLGCNLNIDNLFSGNRLSAQCHM